MKLYFLSAAVAVVAVVSYAGSAQAQDIYSGVALDYNLPHSGDAQQAASLLFGAKADLGQISVGAEADYGAAAAFGGDYDTARLRLMAGYELGSVTALGSLGATRFMNDVGNYDGYNVGLGVQGAISNSLDLRGEVIRDFMDDYGTNVTTTRLSAIYSF